MIAIIDYGMGNIHSVNKALQLFGAKTVVTNNSKDIQSAEKAVLPGVGAFDDAVLELEKQGLINTIKEYLKTKRPFLGICLGMQLLFEESQEALKTKGLGVLKGKVKRFEEKKALKVPHMGWNQLRKVTKSVRKPPRRGQRQCASLPEGDNVTGECPLLNGVADNAYVYFCHSYYPEPKDKNVIASVTDYGKEFASIVWQGNIYGVQFHPEKSQKVGLQIIRNFVEL